MRERGGGGATGDVAFQVRRPKSSHLNDRPAEPHVSLVSCG